MKHKQITLKESTNIKTTPQWWNLNNPRKKIFLALDLKITLIINTLEQVVRMKNLEANNIINKNNNSRKNRKEAKLIREDRLMSNFTMKKRGIIKMKGKIMIMKGK